MFRFGMKPVFLLLTLTTLAVFASHCGSDPAPAVASATAASDSSTGVLPNPASALQ